MLTSLEIENFKGIASRQRIEFAPLTLLFGANSAGKSTILQALVYIHELIKRGNADVDRTELGGDVVELGGFARLVHKHELDRAIVLRAAFRTAGGLERFQRDLSDFPFPDLDDMVENVWLELTIRFRTGGTFRGPVIERAVVGVKEDPRPIVVLEMGTSHRAGGESSRVEIAFDHPFLSFHFRQKAGFTEAYAKGRRTQQTEDQEFGRTVEEAWMLRSNTPQNLLGTGRCVFDIQGSRLSALPPPNKPIRVVSVRPDAQPSDFEVFHQVETFLEMIVLGTTSQLAKFLSDAQYVGPLRAIPPRGFLYERVGRITSWANGLAAWDLLLADRLTLVERTNDWLQKLGTGCKIVVQQLFDRGADAEDLTADHVDKTIRRLLLDTGAGSFVLPSEVGAGISQLVPVIVAAIEGRGGLTLVEQPEIHVHPAVQVGLGDLLVDSARREGRRRIALIETHSEHLLLRVMRRMRETHDGKVPDGVCPVTSTDVSVVLVEKDGERSITRNMPLNERGELVKAWPGGFFEEGLREVL